jgi:glyoxylase-like metal-dependent hydrolase (beta-lactamase superfamily II)
MRYFLSFLFFTFHLFSFDYHLKPYILNNGVNCFFGLSSDILKDNGGNIINSCYIETKEGYIVIDSGPTYSYAQSTYEIMKNKKNLPVKYVINTSADEVHILGNSFFKEQNAILIGPKSYKRDLLDKKKLLISDKISKDALLNTRLIPIDKYLENDLNLTFGDLLVNIKKIKNDDEHLIVYIPNKKIVFAGDMIFNNRIVAFKNNRSILVWQEGIELLKSLEWNDIVSAHGYMTRRSALKNTESYLSLLKSEVKSSILSGESKENAIKNIKLSAFSEDKLYELWHHKNVASVYDELKTKYKFSKPSTLIIKSEPIPIKLSEKKSETVAITKKVKKVSPTVYYVPFSVAEKNAKSKNKIIFVKVRSTTCQYCDELDAVISNDNAVKDILNKYFEVVSLNNDYDPIPYNIRIEHTPTLIFFKPGSEEPLMNLTGIKALGEFLDVLNEAVDDGHKEGYLRP